MKHLIIDGNNIANISFYKAKSILEQEDPENVDKLLCNFGVNVFLNIFHMYLKDSKDHKVYLTWDSRSGANWRKQALTTYKSNRDHSGEKNHDVLYDIMNELKSLFNNYPIIQIEVDNAEADDIIYNLCEILEGQKKIISSDGDMLQIPQRFKDVKVWNPRTKKMAEVPDYDVITYKCICGDTSDCIEGLPKFGPKRTIKLMSENLNGLTDEQKETIENNRIIVDLSKNPSYNHNLAEVEIKLKTSKINYNFNNIQKSYMSLKQKQHFSNSEQIRNLLDEVMKNNDR